MTHSARILDHRAWQRRNSRRDFACRGSGPDAGADTGKRRVARHRGAGVRRARADQPIHSDARTADGRAVPVPGEIRLQRRRSRQRWQTRLRAASASGLFLAPAAMCIAVPDAVPTRRAVLAANMETAVNLVWDAAPLAGERMLVIGAGVVGLLTASLLARIPAARVTVVDIDPAREVLARHLGCDFAAPEASAARAGTGGAHVRQRSRPSAGAGLRRVRGAHHRGKLVRRSRAHRAAWRGFPRAPPAPDRQRRSAPSHPRCVAGAVMRIGWHWHSNCWPIPPMTHCWTGPRGSRICRGRCRAFSRRAACVTLSPTGASECSA